MKSQFRLTLGGGRRENEVRSAPTTNLIYRVCLLATKVSLIEKRRPQSKYIKGSLIQTISKAFSEELSGVAIYNWKATVIWVDKQNKTSFHYYFFTSYVVFYSNTAGPFNQQSAQAHWGASLATHLVANTLGESYIELYPLNTITSIAKLFDCCSSCYNCHNHCV